MAVHMAYIVTPVASSLGRAVTNDETNALKYSSNDRQLDLRCRSAVYVWIEASRR